MLTVLEHTFNCFRFQSNVTIFPNKTFHIYCPDKDKHVLVIKFDKSCKITSKIIIKYTKVY